jgi:ribose transport system ATP-binding protein
MAAANASTEVSPSSLELQGIVKSYGTVEVLHGVDMTVRKGSIHALLGANGAGKSTLVKIAVGATSATGGRIRVDGSERHFASPLDARRAGIGVVFQERSLIPQLSTVDNIFLNGEIRRAGLIDNGRQRRETERIFARLGVSISTNVPCSQLGIADQQMVEIAKAVRLASSVLILDEPTAALTEREVRRLFAVVRQISGAGVGIVYVSHRLPEVLELCDEVTIIRDGRVVLAKPVADTNMEEVVETITGAAPRVKRAEKQAQPPVHTSAAPNLTVKNLRVGSKLHGISFDVRPGETLGIAGLAGSGRSTLLKALFGLVPSNSDQINLVERPFHPSSPSRAIRNGIYLIPENRKTQGLVLSHSVADNLVLSILRRLCVGPLISRRRSDRIVRECIAKFRVHPPDPSKIVERLSGGNQQKVVLGKAFNAHGRILLLDEPTFGVDVHSRMEIQAHVREFIGAGNSVVWVTSDLQELSEVADRILILANGKVSNIVSNCPRLSESEITHLIQGNKDEKPPPQNRLGES